jgi:hypothetical protein
MSCRQQRATAAWPILLHTRHLTHSQPAPPHLVHRSGQQVDAFCAKRIKCERRTECSLGSGQGENKRARRGMMSAALRPNRASQGQPHCAPLCGEKTRAHRVVTLTAPTSPRKHVGSAALPDSALLSTSPRHRCARMPSTLASPLSYLFSLGRNGRSFATEVEVCDDDVDWLCVVRCSCLWCVVSLSGYAMHTQQHAQSCAAN